MYEFFLKMIHYLHVTAMWKEDTECNIDYIQHCLYQLTFDQNDVKIMKGFMFK